MKTRVALIGRHAPEGLGEEVEVVMQENVLFPAAAIECMSIIRKLLLDMDEQYGARVLLQNTPSQVAAALLMMVAAEGGGPGRGGFGGKLGIIVSVPVAAIDGGPRQFAFSHIEWL